VADDEYRRERLFVLVTIAVDAITGMLGLDLVELRSFLVFKRFEQRVSDVPGIPAGNL